MIYKKGNKGLIAVQNKDKRMAYESLLKSYSATINGSGGKKLFLKMVLGELDYRFLREKGLSDFCYMKIQELYQKFPFPDASPETKQAEQDLADSLEEEKIKEEEDIKRSEAEEEYRNLPPEE